MLLTTILVDTNKTKRKDLIQNFLFQHSHVLETYREKIELIFDDVHVVWYILFLADDMRQKISSSSD